jgi:serine/threonine protein kinase
MSIRSYFMQDNLATTLNKISTDIKNGTIRFGNSLKGSSVLSILMTLYLDELNLKSTTPKFPEALQNAAGDKFNQFFNDNPLVLHEFSKAFMMLEEAKKIITSLPINTTTLNVFLKHKKLSDRNFQRVLDYYPRIANFYYKKQFARIRAVFLIDKQKAISELRQLYQYSDKRDSTRKLFQHFFNANPDINNTFGAQIKHQHKVNLKEIKLFLHLHSHLDINDFYENGKLLTDDEIKNLPTPTDNNPVILKKENTGLKYDVICTNGKHYAIYVKVLGKGSFGTVQLAQDLTTRELIAIKTQQLFEKDKPRIEREINNLEESEELLFQFYTNDITQGKSIIGMKLAEGVRGDVDFLKADTILSVQLQKCRNFLLAYKEQIKDKGCLYRDIKLNNTIYNPVANTFTFIDKESIVRGISQTDSKLFGTPPFIAPELIDEFKKTSPDKKHQYTQPSEVFSLAASLLEGLEWANQQYPLYYMELPHQMNVDFKNMSDEVKIAAIVNVLKQTQYTFPLPMIIKENNIHYFFNYGHDSQSYVIKKMDDIPNEISSLDFQLNTLQKTDLPVHAEIYTYIKTWVKNTDSNFFHTNNIADVSLKLYDDITDPDFKEVFDYLVKMIDTNPHDRPTIEEAIAFFDHKIKSSLDITSRIRRIAIFDLNEFADIFLANQNAKLENIYHTTNALNQYLNTFKEADEVIAIQIHDHLKLNTSQLLLIQNTFLKHEIKFTERTFQPEGNNINILDGVKSLVSELNIDYRNQRKIPGFYFVTNKYVTHHQPDFKVIAPVSDNNEIQKNYNENFTPLKVNTINMISDDIKNEIERMETKYTDKNGKISNEVANQRIILLKNYHHTINNEENIFTFSAIENSLKELEKKMYTTGIGIFKVTGAENIQTISDKVSKFSP